MNVLRLRGLLAGLFLTTTIIGAACASGSNSAASRAASAAPRTYIAYIANEASDLVTRVAFTPGSGMVVERSIGIGAAGRIAGPHGVAISADGRYWYVALSHGTPNGRVAKYNAAADTLVGRVAVGLFPETITLTPDGQYLFVANHDLHGGDAVSGISVVYSQTMTEVARPNTCVRPQGGRINALGSKHYSVCNVSDQLVEIDTRSFQVTHRFSVAPGREQSLALDARGGRRGGSAVAGCSPTWAEPGHGGRARFVYVACNRRDSILEIDTQAWQVTRRFAVTGSPYMLRTDATGDRLLATLHADSAVAVIDLGTGTERGRIRIAQRSPHGIAISSDGRFAFVTTEGGGAAKGTVDVIDLASLTRVASVEVGYSPGAIDIRPF